MQRIPSVTGSSMSVTSSGEKSSTELKSENERLRDLLHDKVAQITWYRQTNDRLMHDAARWNYAKAHYAKQLGYDTPAQLQARVDNDMGAFNTFTGVVDHGNTVRQSTQTSDQEPKSDRRGSR